MTRCTAGPDGLSCRKQAFRTLTTMLGSEYIYEVS